MAIEKNYVKAGLVSRFDSEFFVGGRHRERMSSDDDELRKRNFVDSQDDDDEVYDDADSGVGSDDFDLLELGETHSEFCQVGDQTCCVPFELYDLPDLQGILSLDAWNGCLTDEERFSLAKYLPDLDQETFMRTLKELFEGSNFHFGSPVTKLFQMLKGGLCEPRVCLYRQGMSFFQSHKHYHFLRKHQDSMVACFLQTREAWQNCKGYSVEEKLRVLNIVKSQKSLMGERNGDVRYDSYGMEVAGEALCGMKSKGRVTWKRTSHLDSLYGVNPALDVLSQRRPVTIDSAKHSKKNSKGSLNMGGSKTPSLDKMASSHQHGYRSMKCDPYVADLVPFTGGKVTTYDGMTARQMRERMAGGDVERKVMYGITSQRDWNVVQCNMMDQSRSAKSGKKYEASRVGEYDCSSYSSLPFSANNNVLGHKRHANVNQLSDIKVLTSKPSNIRALYDSPKEKYLDPAYVEQMKPTKGRAKGMVSKGNVSGFPNVGESYWSKNREGEVYFTEPSSFDYEDRDVRRKLKFGREFPDSRLKSVQSSQLQMNDRMYRPKKQAKLLLEHVKGSAVRNGGPSMVPFNGGRLSGGGDETESDSSDEHGEEDDLPLIMTKLGTRAHLQNYRAPSTSVFHRNEKRGKIDVKGNTPTVKEMLPVSSTMGDFGRHVPMLGTDTYSSGYRRKSKMRHPSVIQNFFSGVPEDGQYSGYGNAITENNRKSTRRPGSNVQLQAELAENYSISVNKPFPVHKRQKGNAGFDFPLHQSKYLPDVLIEGNGRLFATGPVETGFGNLNSPVPAFASTLDRETGNEAYMVIDGQEGSDCKQYHQETFESIQLRKQIKRRVEADSGSLDAGAEEVPVTEVAVADVELEATPQKKPFILITPTVHTDFSFSVMHLLSAVRVALITPNKVEDSSEAGKQCGTSDVKEEDGNGNGRQCETSHVNEEDGNGNGKQCGSSDVKVEDGNGSHDSTNGSIKKPDVKDGPHDKITTPSLMPPDKTTTPSLTPPEKATASLMPPDKTTIPSLPPPDKITTPSLMSPDKTTIPSITVQEMLNRVRSNPGDPSILETQEPLLDLVRGVMKIFSSRTAPLGAKDWNPLVCYVKASKSWTWTGPVPLSSTDFETPEEVLSPEAWGIPHDMLVKLVDSFADWLKSTQETLRQIASLPAPPAELMQLTFDEKERFKDLRAQRSLNTISTSSEEVRTYFQKEEQLRYAIPDRAFSYTATDGKKSSVAPLRRCGGKPTSKARDHLMLKRDRPPHITILCVVRDAAARLPGSIGTRADVCTLIRDSQFIVLDDVPTDKVNHVVSGALDRLHYERDPCVQYDSERKLWVYLHRDREEEDFEEDGTSSTKKWKRPKKDASELDDQVTVACDGNAEPSGHDTDIHVEPSCAQNDKIVEVGCDDMRQRTEDDDKASDIHGDGAFQQMIENELLCQENYANENCDYNT